jgi:hypothetical protein
MAKNIFVLDIIYEISTWLENTDFLNIRFVFKNIPDDHVTNCISHVKSLVRRNQINNPILKYYVHIPEVFELFRYIPVDRNICELHTMKKDSDKRYYLNAFNANIGNTFTIFGDIHHFMTCEISRIDVRKQVHKQKYESKQYKYIISTRLIIYTTCNHVLVISLTNNESLVDSFELYIPPVWTSILV